MSENTVLVIGAGGFVASHAIPLMVGKGHKVRALLRGAGKAERLRSYGAEVVYGDITDEASIRSALDGVTHIVHLVGISRDVGESTFGRVIIGGTENIVKAAAGTQIKLIYMSALHTTDKTSNLYLATKYAAEQIIKGSGLRYTIFNSSYMYGPRSPFINLMANFATMPIIPVLGPGTQKMQPIFVKDTAAFIEKAVSEPASDNKQFEIAGPDVVTYDGLLDEIAKILGTKPAKLHFPPSLAKVIVNVGTLPVLDQVMAFPSRLMTKDLVGVGGPLIMVPMVTPGEYELLQMDFTADVTPVENALGHKVTPLHDGLLISLGRS